MRAVTIAVGDAYVRLAELAAESVRTYTGLPTTIIQETPGEPVPARWKLRLLDLYPDQTILYFDADTRFVRPWQVLATAAFCAVLDKQSNERDADCRRYEIDTARYVNTGVWIATPDCRQAFAAAWELCHATDYKTQFRYEQTALNVAIQRAKLDVQFLARRYNAICAPETPPPPDAVVLHCAGGSLHGTNRSIWEKAIADASNIQT